MAVKKHLVDLYHEYLALTSNQSAAACLCILDVLGQGEPRTHTLLAGDDGLVVEQAPAPDTGFVPLEQHPAPVAHEQPDEWASLLIAYKELKKR
jgi:hypothetical protein